MTALNKQALRDQSVEGSYYLAECGYCGQVMPSSKLRVLHSPDGEADCYCPHCNAEDSEIFDLGIAGSEVITAWNYQQKRIEELLDELEAAEKRIAELEREQKSLHPVGVMSEKAFHRLENSESRFIALWPRPGIYLPRKRPDDAVIVYARTSAAGIKIKGE